MSICPVVSKRSRQARRVTTSAHQNVQYFFWLNTRSVVSSKAVLGKSNCLCRHCIVLEQADMHWARAQFKDNLLGCFVILAVVPVLGAGELVGVYNAIMQPRSFML